MRHATDDAQRTISLETFRQESYTCCEWNSEAESLLSRGSQVVHRVTLLGMRTNIARLTLCLLWLCACGSSSSGSDPGRVTLHRLNNAEYNNTVRDLLGTTLQPADSFPADDRGYGFDNVADVLRLSPLAVELYERAAQTLVADALRTTEPATTERYELMGSTASGQVLGEGWLFFSVGSVAHSFTAAAAGTYRITVRAYGQQAGPDPAAVSIEIPGQAPQTIAVPAVEAAPALYTASFTLTAGPTSVAVGFPNDFADAGSDRNLWIDYVEISGPYDGPAVDPSKRARIMTCADVASTACQEQILRGFGERAWRRPMLDAELAELQTLVTQAVAAGDPPETGVRLALQAILVSSNFLFRVEIDLSPKSLSPHRLNDYELASRLSYFLWSTMPDDELFAAARSSKLHEPAELERQARRMLADPKSVALVDNFAGQWLFTRALGDQDPDYALFPEYDNELEAAMRIETRRYFEEFLRGDVPMNQFLTADFTFVNDRLAAFYGLPPVNTNEFVRVSLKDTPRRGFLSQASFLRVTSRPKRTSPVLRGKWILDNLLCSPPRPPPPGVESLPDGMMATGSIRSRLEAHVKNDVCASCHRVMDPLGFGLDAFDAIGKFRTQDQGFPVDTTGKLWGELPFTNATDMAALLAAEPLVYRCMVEKLYTYTGRSPNRVEAIEHIDQLTSQFVDSGYSLRELLVAVVTHQSFMTRRGEP